MSWFWILMIGLAFVGAMVKGSEQNKKKEEDAARKKRADDARAAIMASGDKEAIRQLQVMDASYLSRANGSSSTPSVAGNALGTAAAVAGGMVVGNAISGAIASAQLEAAMADIQSDLAATSASFDGLSDLGDIDIDI